MAFIPAVDCLMAELRFNAGANRAENTLYFQGSAGVSTSLATSLGAALKSWWDTNFKARTWSGWSLNEVYITDLTTQTSFTVSYTTGLPLAGTAVGDGLPYNCAHCVSLRTANRGRSGRGRNYILGLLETDTNGSTISAGRQSADVAAYNLLVGAGTFVAGLQLVVCSRFHANAPRATALLQPVTNVLSVDNIVDSQRQRLPGRGF